MVKQTKKTEARRGKTEDKNPWGQKDLPIYLWDQSENYEINYFNKYTK